jgi:hypothetical protein
MVPRLWQCLVALSQNSAVVLTTALTTGNLGSLENGRKRSSE